MRRLEFLINEVRRSTNNTNLNSKTTFDIQNYFNRALRTIQKIVISSNPATLGFADYEDIVLVAGQSVYTLPSDIFSFNSIISVLISTDGISWRSMPFVTPRECEVTAGYYVVENSMHLSPAPSSSGYLRVFYTKALPTVGIRFGKVSASTSGVSVTVTGHGSFNISEQDDYFSIVDKDGIVIVSGLYITSFVVGTGVISTPSTFTGVTTDHYVVAGKYATTHPQIPESCEDYLLKHVERSIFHQDSSSDVNSQDIFTAEERMDLIELFSNNSKDVSYPPITDTTYLEI